MISIGSLEPADRERWQTLFDGYNLFYERVAPPEMFDRAWSEFQAGTRMHALGAKLDGRLVGIAHFLVHPSTTTADVCYLQDLFTDAEVRGQGVGRALIQAVAEWAREQGCARLYWTTRDSNTPARLLYDKLASTDRFIVYRMPL